MTASRRGEISQSPKELIEAAVQRMPKPSLQSVNRHSADEENAGSSASNATP